MTGKLARKSRTIWHAWASFAVDSGMLAMLIAVDWTKLGVPLEAAAGIAVALRLAGAGLAHWLRLNTAEPIRRGGE